MIEVSESSLQDDRTAKLALYARSGIPQYVIVNLVENKVEVYELPEIEEERYAHRDTLIPGQQIHFRTAAQDPLMVPVENVLP